jgi:anti-sigma B factor antagonist
MRLLTGVGSEVEAEAPRNTRHATAVTPSREVAIMDANGLFCTVREYGDVVIVSPHGDIDLAVVDRFWDELRPRLTPAAHVIVDCSDIAFIDSMGLRTLLQAIETAAVHNADFSLAAPSPAVTTVLDLTGIADLFTILKAVPVAEA